MNGFLLFAFVSLRGTCKHSLLRRHQLIRRPHHKMSSSLVTSCPSLGATSSSVSDSGSKPEDRPTGSPRKRRYRPGMNSYLKVDLGAAVFEQLHGAVLDIASSQEVIKPRSLASLHMTLFFGGEILAQELSAEELQRWYQAVQSRLLTAGFVCEQTTPREAMEVDDTKDNDFWFEFSRFETFPPKRNSLIVARFDASPAWQALYQDLRDIAADCSPSLAELMQRSSHQTEFLPHVTLANLGRKSKETSLELGPGPAISDLVGTRIVPCGIAMGGPVPLQVELNWNFQLHGKTEHPEV